MTTEKLTEDKPCYISKGLWDLTPTLEERIKGYMIRYNSCYEEARRKLFNSMNMGCFE